MTDRIRWIQDGRAMDLTLVGRLLAPESVAGDAHCRIGGQAHLYRVRTPTGEVRACKLAIDPENNSLLRREHDHYQRLHRDSARAAEWLLRCHGQGEHGGRAFLVLDWVEQSLRDRFPTASGAQNLASGPGPTLRERLRWAAAACDTIAAFHAAAGSTIIHQDIKPGNFLVAAEDPPRLLLSDLAGSRGLLRKTNGRSTTRPGAVTEGYAPPELELPQGVRRPTVQVDRFSLAVTVYEVVTGQRPLKAGLSGAFSSDGKRLHELHKEVVLGEGLPNEEEEEYRVLGERALPELLHIKGTLLGPRFGEHLVRAFGEGAEAERRAKRLGDKLKEALAVSPEDRRVSPDSLADLCRDLADAVGVEPPKVVEAPRPRPLPRPNQAGSVGVRRGPRRRSRRRRYPGRRCLPESPRRQLWGQSRRIPRGSRRRRARPPGDRPPRRRRLPVRARKRSGAYQRLRLVPCRTPRRGGPVAFLGWQPSSAWCSGQCRSSAALGLSAGNWRAYLKRLVMPSTPGPSRWGARSPPPLRWGTSPG
jgi:serine/threonine protein kinase